jgi:hypothetical protein
MSSKRTISFRHSFIFNKTMKSQRDFFGTMQYWVLLPCLHFHSRAILMLSDSLKFHTVCLSISRKVDFTPLQPAIQDAAILKVDKNNVKVQLGVQRRKAPNHINLWLGVHCCSSLVFVLNTIFSSSKIRNYQNVRT